MTGIALSKWEILFGLYFTTFKCDFLVLLLMILGKSYLQLTCHVWLQVDVFNFTLITSDAFAIFLLKNWHYKMGLISIEQTWKNISLQKMPSYYPEICVNFLKFSSFSHWEGWDKNEMVNSNTIPKTRLSSS